jgi:DHA2 family multidrug resistance protein
VFLVRAYHFDATQVGEIMIPGSILTAMMMPFIGRALGSGTDPRKLIFIGFFAIELCLYVMTKFSPFTGKDMILNVLFIRGFAMAFLFIPINSTILSEFKGVELGQASGLLNLFRQIGGSIGIALIATMLTTKSAQNYAELNSKVSRLNPQVEVTYQNLSRGMMQKLPDQLQRASPTQAAAKILTFKIQNQVFMMSFLQLMWTVMAIMSLSFLPIFLLEVRDGPVGVVDAH